MLLFGLVLFPILGLIGSSAGTAWFVPVPFGAIALVCTVGFVLTLGLLALITRVRSVPAAWVVASAALLCVLLTSLYPAVAVAQAGVDQGGQVIPWILGWIGRTTGVFS
ncbi:hypothetical protein [Cryobacterium sp. PAMC25264]|uniref:hypothetical protein n=1 Tax=Cryobacterium sp. PAMC25264 TaxID=2861288 RepID=UPI001C6385BB|nr:hypothetical protein [Cryobacterium sp. PAMC25264]QYF72944.1 hypothetical protein KY500_14365 [Cryobacterium sp. PAMC25264]